jgi:hypothetical protein
MRWNIQDYLLDVIAVGNDAPFHFELCRYHFLQYLSQAATASK